MQQTIKLGNLTLPRTAGLAPMAGVADRAYRILCKEHQAALLVSEMISAKGLCYGDPKTAQFCTITDAERPMGLQLFGSEPDFMAKAVQIVLPYQPDWIDINMGCPVHKVITTGSGSALMQKPDLAADLVRAAVSVSSVPITVKFRAGWDDNDRNAVSFAKKMEQAGAAAVAVHGRTKAQLYSGKADWEIIRQVKESVSIPVFGNGDVTDAESCLKMYEQTGGNGWNALPKADPLRKNGHHALSYPPDFATCRWKAAGTCHSRGSQTRCLVYQRFTWSSCFSGKMLSAAILCRGGTAGGRCQGGESRVKRYPSKPKPIPTSTSFDIRPRHVVTIDLHGLSVAEARAKLKQVLEHCPKTVTEVEVIHGYHSGQALQKLVRKDFKHARIASRSFGLQNGITNYILK